MNLIKARYFLKNYPQQIGVEIISDTFTIAIIPQPIKFRNLNLLNVQIEEARETVELVITKTQSSDEALVIAQGIKNLLQLAFAKRITFDRQEYVYDQKTTVTQKEMSDSNASGYQIVHELDLKQYIAECLNTWNNLSEEEKDVLSASINYLNQTYEDFIEDWILRTIQAWESVATYWQIKDDLPNEIQRLRDNILATYKLWRNDYPSLDSTGQIGSALTRAVDQQKLISRLENLVKKYQLDIAKLKIDFRTLISLRDQVAHRGKIDKKGYEVIDLMESAIKGLQIILLLALGYKGKIIPNTIGFYERKEISEFISPPQQST